MDDIPGPIRPDGKEIHSVFRVPWETCIYSGRHMAEFARIDKNYFASSPGEDFVEVDAEARVRHYKFRYKAPPPRILGHIAADVVSNLRASLDQAAYACALASGLSSPRKTYFPFGKSEADVARLRGTGGCADLPLEIFDVMASFRPFEAGNVYLWALNKLNNAHKHRLTVTNAGSAIHAMEAVLRRMPFDFFWSDVPPMPRWDPSRQELTWASVNLDSELQPKPQLQLFVSFSEPKELTAQPALAAMNRMGEIVVEILMRVEDEARCIGLLQ